MGKYKVGIKLPQSPIAVKLQARSCSSLQIVRLFIRYCRIPYKHNYHAICIRYNFIETFLALIPYKQVVDLHTIKLFNFNNENVLSELKDFLNIENVKQLQKVVVIYGTLKILKF